MAKKKATKKETNFYSPPVKAVEPKEPPPVATPPATPPAVPLEVLKCLRDLADFSVDDSRYRRALRSAQARADAYVLLAKYE